MNEKISEIILEYRKRTEKECCFINYSNEIPNILDDKIGGTPYLPIGEEYPKDKYGNPMALLIQVNLSKLNIDGYPKGIFELFVTTNENDLFGFEIEEGSFEIRFFEEELDYQTLLPEVKLETFLINNPFKINFIKGKMNLPLQDSDAVNLLKNIYEEICETKIINSDEIPQLFGVDDYWDLQMKVSGDDVFSSHIGGYASFANDPDMNYSTDEGSFIYISSDLDDVFKLGNAMCFYVLISKEALRDKRFAEVTCNFEWS